MAGKPTVKLASLALAVAVYVPKRSSLFSAVAGSCQEPPDVRGAGGGGDPQGADQRAGREERPAGEGELPAQEPGESGAAGEVPVSHPDGRAATPGQSQRAGGSRTPAATPADLQPQHWFCCISGSALGRAEPLSLSDYGPPFECKRHQIASAENPSKIMKAKHLGFK